MTDSELAVIAVSRTLFELLISKNLITANEADNLLAIQQRGFEQQQQIAAAGVLGTVRSLLSKSHPISGSKH